METLGENKTAGRTRRAERALGARLAEVEKGMRKPRRRTFGDLLDEFEAVALPARPRKKSTVVDYTATIRNHLRPAFGGPMTSRTLSRVPDQFERYVVGKARRWALAEEVRNHLVSSGSCSRRRDAGAGSARTRSSSWTRRRCRIPTRRRSAPLRWLACSRLPGAGTRRREGRRALVRGRTAYHDARALDRPAEGRATRPALAGRRASRSTSARPPGVRPKRDDDPEAKAGRRTVDLGDVAAAALEEQFASSLLSGTGVDRVLSPCARHAARSVEAHYVAERRSTGPASRRSSAHGMVCGTRR